MVKKLTPLQERFLLFYRQCGDAAEAAGMAGYRRDLQKAGKRNLTLLKEWLDDPEKKTDGKEENMRKPDVWEEPSAPEEDETAGEEEVMRVLTRIIHRKEADHVLLKVKTKKSYTDENGKRVIEENTEDRIAEVPPRISDINRAAELLAKQFGGLVETEKKPEAVQVKIIDDIGLKTDGD